MNYKDLLKVKIAQKLVNLNAILNRENQKKFEINSK